MKKFYKIALLFILFIFLTSYNPNKFDLIFEDNSNFFRIKKIVVINNLLVEERDVYKKLEKIHNKSIFSIKRKDVEISLKTIDFLEKVEVKKRYPDTVIVKIFETKPVGFFFKDKKKYLLDSSSNLILYDEKHKFNQLPNIFGDGAEKNLTNFLSLLENNHFPIKKIKSFYYFQIGRWDLQLANNKIVKFPYEVTNNIIKKSVELLNRKDFENYNIIDLRVDGRIIAE